MNYASCHQGGVVDEDDIDREIIRQFLVCRGYEVRDATGGAGVSHLFSTM
jgi:hypothetical protein